MKSIINLIVITLVILFAVSFLSCKKPVVKNEIKCKCHSTMQVVAQDLIGNCLNEQDNSTVYIENWNELNIMAKPGNKYEITYDEVPCKEMNCEGDNNGIDKGGCFPRKICVKACNIKLIPNNSEEKDCNGTTTNFELANCINAGIGNAVITNHILNVDCSDRGFNNYVLACDLEYCVNDKTTSNIIPVQVMTNAELAPPIEKDIIESKCFNLKELKNTILSLNSKQAPQNVMLKVIYNNEKSELVSWKLY